MPFSSGNVAREYAGRYAFPGKKGKLRDDLLGYVDTLTTVPAPKPGYDIDSIAFKIEGLDGDDHDVTIKFVTNTSLEFEWWVDRTFGKKKLKKDKHGCDHTWKKEPKCKGDGIPWDWFGTFKEFTVQSTNGPVTGFIIVTAKDSDGKTETYAATEFDIKGK